MRTRSIPISEQHEIFCAEDIEIWEVTLMNEGSGNDNDFVGGGGVGASSPPSTVLNVRGLGESSQPFISSTGFSADAISIASSLSAPRLQLGPASVRMLSWGTSLPEVQARLAGPLVTILQRQQQEAGAGMGVGCYLWPSSVVLARY